MARRRDDEVVVITTAQPSRLAELEARKRRYVITMLIRAAAFVLAVVLYATVGGPWGVVAAVVATVLPWVAVVAANAGPKRYDEEPSLYPGDLQQGERRRLPGGSTYDPPREGQP